MMRGVLWASVVSLGLALTLGGCKGAGAETETETETEAERSGVPAEGKIVVSAAGFGHEASIPTRYTCDGEDISPALAWSGVPEGAVSLVLICDDPDAPVGTWVHWVLYGLPVDAVGLPEGVKAGEEVGGVDGRNSWKKTGYGGPCPPKGPSHRYYFRVYALDAELELKAGATRKQVDEAMVGHVLAEGVLMGTYTRGG